MATPVTWEALIEAEARLLWRERPVVKSTATGGSTTTWVDSSLGYTSHSAYHYDGVRVFVLDTTDDGAPKGRESRVVLGGFTPASGSLSVTPAYPSPVEAGDTALFLYNNISYQNMLDATNRIVAAHYWPRYIAMSLLTDGDMEDVTTQAYTATGGATLSKTTGTVFTGTRALQVTVTASGAGVETSSLPVNGNEQIYVSVVLKLVDATKSVTVDLYDVSNAAVLGPSYTVSGSDWTEVRFAQPLTATTENVKVRVRSAAAGTFTFYVDYIQVRSNQRAFLTVPPQITDAAYLDGVYYPDWTRAGVENYTYNPLSFQMTLFDVPELQRDYAAVTSHRVNIACPQLVPLFWKFRARDAALTSLTSTTFGDQEVIVYGAAAELAGTIADHLPLARDRRVWQEKAAMWSNRHQKILDSLQLLRPSPVRRMRAMLVP